MKMAAKTTIAPHMTMAGVRVRTRALSPVVTRGPRMALLPVVLTVIRLSSAGSEKNEITPAKQMPIAANRPSCRMGETLVAERERNPAAVLTVVRIIGMPTSDRAARTRPMESDCFADSWKWVTKWRPSADPMTITKIGTSRVTMSTFRPRPKINPNVQRAPMPAGRSDRALSRRSPIVR